jgi:7,8-dihydropterin-6-yl-methyl-4-(beta-D-ribofuranosyl)aminobenzene 5'-phosphate synthase
MTHLIALLILIAGPICAAEPARVDQLRVQILSTMLADRQGIGEWGFAAVVELPGKRILFDTGAQPDTVLRNARDLKVDLAGIDDVILSHNHGDHTAGLVTLRRELGKQRKQAVGRAFVAAGIFEGMFSDTDPATKGQELNRALIDRPAYEALAGTYVIVDQPREIAPGVWLTGPIPRRYPERNYVPGIKRRTSAGLVDDTVAEDMSLVVNTPKGLVVITGCAHAGIVNILAYAHEKIGGPIYAVIGGMHLFQLSEEKLDWTAGELRKLGVQQLLAAHCTGIEATMHLRRVLGLSRKTAPVGAVGATFDLQSGIAAGTIAQ